MIVCDRDKLKYGRVYGAPDFVVEVLSASTAKKDGALKLSKYCNADVKEYWLVDPKKKRVVVYDLEKDAFPTVYTFEDEVPVGIFEGKCKVDFKEIYEYAQFLFEQEED
jgi:Uma2 family endonuclease